MLIATQFFFFAANPNRQDDLYRGDNMLSKRLAQIIKQLKIFNLG